MMKIDNAVKRITVVLAILIVTIICLTDLASATGISVDAGLTPAQNRWLIRSQLRYTHRDNHPVMSKNEMEMYMAPVVIAYGVRSDFAVMVRQVIKRSEMTMGMNQTTNSGLTDLFVLGKYRLARINTPKYTFGIAPTLGLEIPSGDKDFSSNSWDLLMGCYLSGRMRSLGVDLNVSYNWVGMATTNRSDGDGGDEFSVEGALAYQFALGSSGEFSMAPVIELTYQNMSSDVKNGTVVANSGESVVMLSPGLKVTRSSLILEGLLQIPIWQDQNGLQTERAPGFIIGFRLMN